MLAERARGMGFARSGVRNPPGRWTGRALDGVVSLESQRTRPRFRAARGGWNRGGALSCLLTPFAFELYTQNWPWFVFGSFRNSHGGGFCASELAS